MQRLKKNGFLTECISYILTTRVELYTMNIGEDEYKEGIFRILEPLYMSAQNAGYKKWVNRWGA